MNTQIPTKEQYEDNERKLFNKQRNLTGRSFTKAERDENNKKMFNALCELPELIAERIQWLIDGHYGYGACQAAKAVLKSNMNRPAWLLQTIAALEWYVSARDLNKLWHKLNSDQQAVLNSWINLVITTSLKDEQS